MSEHDFSLLYAQYPTVIAQMDETFTSHEFIERLARANQTLYIEALYAYRHSLHAGSSAQFKMVHGILAKQLAQFSNLVEYKGDVDSNNIFSQKNKCAQWRKRAAIQH